MGAERISEPGGLTVGAQGLKAQAALLPYALAAFGVSLPVFVWTGSHAANAEWMSASFVLFALGWGAFYAVVNWLKTPAAADEARRGRVHILAGLVWAGAIAQVAIFADGAGPARQLLLLLTLAAAMTTVVFTAPWLPSLLIVAPATLAAPLIMLFMRGQDLATARLALGATALSLALALMVNRILRSQFALAAEREVLVVERAEQAEAARRLARSKSDLVSTMAGEIRGGLTGVAHVLAAAVGKDGRSAPSRQQLSAALDAVSDVLAALDTTLDAETAEAGRLTVSLRPLDLVSLARDVMVLHRPAAAARGLELTLHVDELAPGAAIGDPLRTRQVLSALVGNAVKFTARGRVELRVGLTDGGRLAVAVADTGPGLTEDELALAVQPFQRIPRTCAGATGAGLGLTLAVQLARLMNGELQTESAIGVGSCFTLELPFDPDARIEATPAPVRRAPEPAERRLRILVAEPETLSAAMLRASLEQLGHQVVQAADGARAVELARVCDLDLAVIATPETVTALRALPGAAGCTPVVALIGGDGEEASEAADALLRKPAGAPALARALAEALAAHSAANDRGAPGRAASVKPAAT